MLDYRQTEQYRNEQIEIAERRRLLRELEDEQEFQPRIEPFRSRKESR